jgi:hypothetical protein
MRPDSDLLSAIRGPWLQLAAAELRPVALRFRLAASAARWRH